MPTTYINGSDTQLRIIQRTLVLIFTTLSLLCGLAVTFTYGCIYQHDRRKANRVTLRMVMIATISSIFYCCFNIYNWSIIYTSMACDSTRIILLFFNALSTCALACVGVNLLFMFVFRIKNYSKMEWYYYGALLVLPLISISVPIYQTTLPGSNSITQFDKYHSCWYYTHHFEGLDVINFYWLWYFCFLFVIIVISAMSSFIALVKLYRNIRKARNETEICGELSINTEYPINVIGKVVIRCILYALVPFIVNIWTFCLQVIEINPPRYHSPIAIFDAIFSSCSGILISIIFFSEPTITAYISEKYRSKREIYYNEKEKNESIKHEKYNDDIYSKQLPLTNTYSNTIVSNDSYQLPQPQQKQKINNNNDNPLHHSIPIVQINSIDDKNNNNIEKDDDSRSQDTIVPPPPIFQSPSLSSPSQPPSPHLSYHHTTVHSKKNSHDNNNNTYHSTNNNSTDSIPMTERNQITNTAKWILHQLKSETPL